MKSFPINHTPEQRIYYCFNELRFYKLYINKSEQFIKEINDRYIESLNTNSDSFFKLAQEFNYQHNLSADLSIKFPDTLRKSVFISLWSYFENSLNILCQIYEYHNSLNVNYKDLKCKDRGIDRTKLYLTKVVQLDFPTSLNWNKIKKLQSIRNKIVHSYSEVNNNDVKILSNINYFQYLKLYPLNSTSIIEIEELFLECVITIFECFYKELLDSIKKKDK